MTAPNSRKIDVFFYGLFMDEDLLRAKGINPLARRIGLVQNFRLLIGARATLTPCEAGTVYGVIYSLTHEEVDRLYSEPSVSGYRPEAVIAHLSDGAVVAALCFNLPTFPSPADRNPEYAAKLKDLASRIGLPHSYLSSIE